MGEKNIKTTDKLIFAGFSTWFVGGGCQRQAVIPTPCGVREGWWRHWLGNPIVYKLPLGSADDNENETTEVMHVACLHVDTLDFLDTICVVAVKF